MTFHQGWAAVAALVGLLAGTMSAQAQTTYTFTQYKQGTGSGVVTSSPAGIDCGSTCSASFVSGTSLTLTAAANTDHIFMGWSGWCTGTAPTCTLTLSGNRYASATFEPPTLPLTVAKYGGTGTLTSTPAGIDCGSTCTASFTTNGSVTLTAIPDTDQIFKSWSGCPSVSGTTCTVTMSAVKTIYVYFAPAQYSLTVTKSGGGTGTITSTPAGIDCGGTCTAGFANGASVTLTATADAGYLFQGWSGACSGLANSCTIAMSAAKSVTATFGLPTTTFQYDANGNLTQVTDPLGQVRKTSYDALDRPYLVQEPSATTPGSTQGQITTGYDGQDQVASVKDPRNLTTGYTVDGLGNLTSLTSPDTGTTTYGYDAAGNLLSRADARGRLATYSYDVLNRLVQIQYDDQSVSFTWDTCANGVGRLCRIDDGSGSTVFAYDAQGRIIGKTQTIGGVSLGIAYGYDGSGRLTSLTLPSGRSVGYVWAAGRVSGITVDGAPLLSAAAHEPFGPVAGWTWGNGEEAARVYDLAGRLTGLSLGRDAAGQEDARWYYYDGAGRIQAMRTATATSRNQLHSYDGLDRLIATQLGEPALSSLAYSYDLSGNRTRQTTDGSITNYTVASSSNRLTALTGARAKSFGFDATGNVTADGSLILYVFDGAGRRVRATVSGQVWDYAYNAQGQRVQKSGGGSTTLYVYDEAGHLLGEYGATGAPVQETVWFGDIPVATLRPGGGLYYVHADHLNTPRRITRPADNLPVWEWEGEAFGYAAPDQNPAGLGSFSYSLRFPGQIADLETGTFYNYYRDYDPSTGRYGESDPIGLDGGINTYSYVGENPLRYVDPMGLETTGFNCLGCHHPVPTLPFAPTQPGNGSPAGSGNSSPSSSTDSAKNCTGCQPCTPYPAGTIGYIGPHYDNHYSKYHGMYLNPHLNLYFVTQDKECTCRWKKAWPDAVPPPAPLNWVDLNGGFPPLFP